MRKLLFVMLIGVLVVSLNFASAKDGRTDESLIAKVDTVMFEVKQPKEFFGLLNETFKLPVAWEYSNFDGYSNGGVKCGNVNLESLELASVTPSIIGITGIAFEPAVEGNELIKVLNQRGIGYSQNDLGPLTITELQSVLPGTMIHLIEYKSYAVPFMKNSPLPENPAGIESVQEIIIGVTNFEKSRKTWQTILAPIPEGSIGIWEPKRGPRIHLVPSNVNGVQALKLQVISLAQTENFLKEFGLLGWKGAGSVKTDPDKTMGVTLEFVE